LLYHHVGCGYEPGKVGFPRQAGQSGVQEIEDCHGIFKDLGNFQHQPADEHRHHGRFDTVAHAVANDYTCLRFPDWDKEEKVAGQVVSQMSGMSLADVFNPGFDANVSVFSQLFFFLTLAVFVALGGHQIVMEALLETFRWAPPGQAVLGDNVVETLTAILTQSFWLGLRAAAPMLTALFLSTIVLGLISRTLPQLNILLVGFNLNALLTLAAMFISLGALAWTFQEQTEEVLQSLQGVIERR